MKVTKKLLSLLLVVMLLATAIPFQALAGTVTTYRVYAMIYNASGTLVKEWQSTNTFVESEATGWSIEKFTNRITWLGNNNYQIDRIEEGTVGTHNNEDAIVYNLIVSKPTNYINFTVNFNEPTGTKTSKTFSAAEGTTYLAFLSQQGIAVPTFTGYTFWYWTSSQQGQVVDATAAAEGDVISAVWKKNDYTISYDLNYEGSVPTKDPFGVEYGASFYSKLYEYRPVRSGYEFLGWTIDGELIEAGDTYTWTYDTVAKANWRKTSETTSGTVYLMIYINGDTTNLWKSVNVSSYCTDGSLTQNEAATAIKGVATPTSKGFSYMGLYRSEASMRSSYKSNTAGETSIATTGEATQYIYVVVDNVKVSAWDPSNPKTGDYILTTALTVMGLSGIAAAAVYVTGKKRKV